MVEANKERIVTAASIATLKTAELAPFLHVSSPEILLALIANPQLSETQLCQLLERKDLPTEILEALSRRRDLLKIYRVKRALAFHPRVPRLVGIKLLKDLYLMDLVQVALQPGISAELKRNAEEQLAARLPQLPLGQKVTLARRGPARVAAALLAEGHQQVLTVVFDNPNLTESQILKTLARERIFPHVVHAIAHQRKWSHSYNVRLALVRNPHSALSTILAFLPELTVSDLRELASPGIVPENLRKYLLAEIQRRVRISEKLTKDLDTALPPPPSKQG